VRFELVLFVFCLWVNEWVWVSEQVSMSVHDGGSRFLWNVSTHLPSYDKRQFFLMSTMRILLKPVCDAAEVEPYDCQLCASSFHAKNSLRLHYVTAHISKRMACDVCGKRFSDPRLFKSHRLFHKLQAHVCDVCGQQFCSYFGYKTHTRSHQQVMHILTLIANMITLPKWTERQALVWQHPYVMILCFMQTYALWTDFK
jgi:hypothetical protein